MKRIDKNTYRDVFNVYGKDYLRDSRVTGEFVPSLSSESLYSNFSKNDYKRTAHPEGSRFEGWLQVLLEEAGGRCCYCMRELTENEISVEHLVPENFRGLNENDEYGFYAGIASEIRDYVELGSQSALHYDGNTDIDSITKFPHLIAHSNLFPACKKDFGCSCNNHRGNNRILPMMLMDNVEDFVVYNDEGKMEILYPDRDILNRTLEALDINTPELKRIRKLWYLFSRIGINPLQEEHSENYQVDSLLRQALGWLDNTGRIPDEYLSYFNDEASVLSRFNDFLQYSWFYDYYTRKYPPQP